MNATTMKFLLAVSSREYSADTLRLGTRVAMMFGAALTVAYVGRKPHEMHATQINMARDNLSRWKIYHPGVDVLHWAFEEIQTLCPLESGIRESSFDPDQFVKEDDRYRFILPKSVDCPVDLILREGEIITELREELLDDQYDLTIIGASRGKRKKAHDLLQYLPCSVFVVQNLDLERDYKILLLVDDSDATKRAVNFGATIAQQMGYPIRTLTVSKTRRFGPGYSGAAEAAREALQAQGLEPEQFFLTGDPVNTFVEFAGEDHILVMGASSQNPLRKLFRGSKPIQTLKRSNAPILIVK